MTIAHSSEESTSRLTGFFYSRSSAADNSTIRTASSAAAARGAWSPPAILSARY